MTDYLSIYEKAISSLEDPILTQIYTQSKIEFCSKMYTHLMRAIWLFNTPYYEVEKLNNAATAPTSAAVYATGDGTTVTFTIDNPLQGNSSLITEGYVDGKRVDGYYNEELHTFTFKSAPALNSQIIFNQYLTGCFSLSLNQTEETILALLLVSCWSEKEENFLLDIRRLLTTSDFKLHDSSSVLRSKVNWHYTMYEQAQKLMNNYSLTLMKKGVLSGNY